MRNQQNQHVGRWFLQQFKGSVLRVRVHGIRPVDDQNAPGCFPRREMQESKRIAYRIHADLAACTGRFDHPQVRVAARRNAAEDRIVGWQIQRRRLRLRQQKSRLSGKGTAGEPECEGRLSDAARASQNPGVMQPAGGKTGCKHPAGGRMADQPFLHSGLR